MPYKDRNWTIDCHRLMRRRWRYEALKHYSGNKEPECACCGERRHEFLSFDHIDGGGKLHRDEIGNDGIVAFLRHNNYPPGFRVLCHNCNQAIGFFGYCPHELEREAVGVQSILEVAVTTRKMQLVELYG